MTAMLGCDGCGQIVSEREGDDDAASGWWVLSSGPTIGGGLLPVLAGLTLALGDDDDDLDDGERAVELDTQPVEPVRHFCSLGCLEDWVRRMRELGTAGHPSRR